MFSIFDGFVNALTEALNPTKSKFDDRASLTSDDLTIKNIPDIYYCQKALDIKDLAICENCNHAMYKSEIESGKRTVERSYDEWDYSREEYREIVRQVEEDYECCPYCRYGEDEDEEFTYFTLDLDSLIWEFKYIANLDDYTEKGFKEAFIKYIQKQEDGEDLVTESIGEKKKPEKDDENFTKLKETVKKEMYKYLKANGIDIEHLIKSGVELDSMKSVIDKMLDTYVATSIADYENEYNIGLAWDYTIDNNDIIISIDTM